MPDTSPLLPKTMHHTAPLLACHAAHPAVVLVQDSHKNPQQTGVHSNHFLHSPPAAHPTSSDCAGACVQDAKRGTGGTAVFIARNRFAVLDKGSNQILVKNLRNEITKKCAAPCASTDAIFYAGTGTLLCRSDDKVGSCLTGSIRGSAAGKLLRRPAA